MTTPGVSSWPYKEGKASREDIKGTREGSVRYTPGPRWGSSLPRGCSPTSSASPTSSKSWSPKMLTKLGENVAWHLSYIASNSFASCYEAYQYTVVSSCYWCHQLPNGHPIPELMQSYGIGWAEENDRVLKRNSFMWFGRVERKEKKKKGNWMELYVEYEKDGARPRAKSQDRPGWKWLWVIWMSWAHSKLSGPRCSKKKDFGDTYVCLELPFGSSQHEWLYKMVCVCVCVCYYPICFAFGSQYLICPNIRFAIFTLWVHKKMFGRRCANMKLARK